MSLLKLRREATSNQIERRTWFI